MQPSSGAGESKKETLCQGEQGGGSELYEDTTPGWELVSIKAALWAGARSEACLLVLMLMHFISVTLNITLKLFHSYKW